MGPTAHASENVIRAAICTPLVIVFLLAETARSCSSYSCPEVRMFLCRPLSARAAKGLSVNDACAKASRLAQRQRVGIVDDLDRRATVVAIKASAGETHKPKKPSKLLANFCPVCGGRIELAIPSGELEWRHVCTECRRVMYFNPKMIVGVICEHEGKILMCKRAIEPCRGQWTVPAGYMEMAESSAEGAARETWEEALARVQILAPFAHFDIPRIGQAYMLFRAKLQAPYTYGPSSESLETVLMHPDDIPFDQVAFSSISIALRLFVEDLRAGRVRAHHGVIDKAEGSLPNAPGSYRLRDHMVAHLDNFSTES